MALECEFEFPFEFPFECVWLRAFEQTKTQFESLATNLQGICNISHCYRYLAVVPHSWQPWQASAIRDLLCSSFFLFFLYRPKISLHEQWVIDSLYPVAARVATVGLNAFIEHSNMRPRRQPWHQLRRP